jgi:acrylyl-CoA reductase (NADPH)
MPKRLIAWDRIAHTVDKKMISEITQSRPLSEAMSTAEEVIAGRIRGRVVIDIDG